MSLRGFKKSYRFYGEYKNHISEYVPRSFSAWNICIWEVIEGNISTKCMASLGVWKALMCRSSTVLMGYLSFFYFFSSHLYQVLWHSIPRSAFHSGAVGPSPAASYIGNELFKVPEPTTWGIIPGTGRSCRVPISQLQSDMDKLSTFSTVGKNKPRICGRLVGGSSAFITKSNAGLKEKML